MRKNERQGFENLRRVIKVERKGSRGDKTYEETGLFSFLCGRKKNRDNFPEI
ncbi:transposase [Microcystis aeruginosa TAIHU98]|uniref:Transposase n=1 Tax=Microcystis aeruginosa TAIHU98 TaxID=1134457 RepID=L7EBY6_MICAE|nr:transposase [Microcystis aeruginosa TAIHU98]ODV39286.1 Mobile element protein [Microcystis aeruginosa NIES-98]